MLGTRDPFHFNRVSVSEISRRRLKAYIFYHRLKSFYKLRKKCAKDRGGASRVFICAGWKKALAGGGIGF